MTDDDADDYEMPMSRREVVGTTGAIGAAVLGAQAVQTAAAQTDNEPRIKLGSGDGDYVIDDDPDGNGDLVVRHVASGAEFRYDSSTGKWTLGTLNVSELEVQNVGAKARADTAQSMPSGTSTKIELQATVFEHSDIVQVNESNDSLDIQKDGIYDCTAGVQLIDSISDGTRWVCQIRNNGTLIAKYDSTIGGSNNPSVVVPFTTSLQSGATLTMEFLHDEGSSVDVVGDERTSISAIRQGI